MTNFDSTSPIAMEMSSAITQVAARMGHPLVGTVTLLEILREHLQWAIELEHSMIPPYLCALYSIEPGCNLEAVEVIGRIVSEEMLHITLAANLLNAVGGRPRLAIPMMLPGYPRPIPFCDRSFEVSLFRFGPAAIENFVKMEQLPPTSFPLAGEHRETRGQFYVAIKRELRAISESLGEADVFCGDPARQVTEQRFCSGGRIIAINDLASALAALEIVEQGHGAGHAHVAGRDNGVFHPERARVAHYYRFHELKLGRRYRQGDTLWSGPTGDPISIDWDRVRPMQNNPRMCEHAPGSPIRVAQEKFNHCYYALLQLLEEAFNGAPQTLGAAMGAMCRLRVQAEALVQMPTQDGIATAGPTFEYVALNRRTRRSQSR